ncbi:RNA polymerase sigma factor [Niabella sp. CJ426]|jgi:RNA polymerase sigma factor (sigma-70 family)|uniref:Sigma-70 family RNA polymerase sigma factor n=1 Tax=Niabella yanshanensis TaxID=577386 RepID=A0ABZ0WBE8_9BACT|nr:sigma-70 family RNA polymerase sigma factor [Niabella yanshanensis]ULT46509.1 sigma-70 family RNA polymerase sigma factor [Niabella sp. I65]WQD39465.1 sigma-70 family RNA polymerase sigma factor [Niabella yanshanensis]HTG55295.1 sigma-70 family RNA polymerase sigma factor [Niabella sp.]
MTTDIKKSDNELIHLFTSGNESALDSLLERYKDKLFNTILFIVKDKYHAEDISQDVFIKIIETLKSGKYKEEGKFLPWAMRIAHNLCVDYFRKLKRFPFAKSNTDNEVLDTINCTEQNAEDKIIKVQSMGKAKDLLEQLPEEQREVIILRHFANLSFKEIADMTGCSINTALGRMRYGLMNLRKLMTGK